ncbi:hypothetical protein F8M41_005634 [Gigaspora margarita]|uniref:Uncharacterized protein n=1 Tax=Gigaspora margarita TaxID=4874 RepID=A0A8H3X9S0_GIGMA|nr:hypothetical protein F8M41_005634 [Gigaspora margarita]
MAAVSKYLKCHEDHLANRIRVFYRCYHAEVYKSVAGNDQTDKKPKKSKKFIKCGYKSQLVVTTTSSSEMPQMIVKYIPHLGHISGSVKDIGTLRISQEVHEWIANNIRSGLNISKISQLFQKRACDIEKAWQE